MLHFIPPLPGRLFLVGLIFSGVSFAADPMDRLCMSKLDNAEVKVTVDPPSVVYRYNKNTAELKEMSRLGGRGTILGLTVTRKEASIVPDATILPLPDGRFCVRPKFRIKIHLNPQTVYIGSEFPEGSCSFKDIMGHEMKHVKVNQSHAEAVSRSYEAQMKRAFGNKVFYGTSIEQIKRELVSTVKNGWLPHLMKEIEKSDVLHARIDTKQESIRAGMACNREVPRILSNYEYFENE